MLTDKELTALTTWKWQYMLEVLGFTPAQAPRLVLLKFVVFTRRLVS